MSLLPKNIKKLKDLYSIYYGYDLPIVLYIENSSFQIIKFEIYIIL